MPTFVDLLWQVKNKLPIKFGGTGNALGAAREMVMLAYDNDTGGALALGTLVKLHGSSFDDLRVIPTTTANELGVLGVVVGRFTQGDGLGLFEAVAPAHQDTVAVCISGRCRVLVESSVTQGQYAYVAATDGKAAGTSSVPLGQIGIFESDGTTSALVVLGNRAAITAPEDVYEDGVLAVDGFHILDFGAHLDVAASGTTASVDVVTDDMTLDAEQILVEDVGTYYTPDAPTTGTETLRPTSDVETVGTPVYSSGSTGWNLVDESSLNTADYYVGDNTGAAQWRIVHGFPASALTTGQRIDSVVIKGDTTLSLGGSDAGFYVRNPGTGSSTEVYNFNPGGANPKSYTMTTRPWDSQPWELTDVQNLQVGFGQNSGPGNSGKIHQLYLEVNWTRRVTVESALAELGASGGGGNIEDLPTAEMDDTLVLAPDGAGGVEFRAEVGGSGGGGTSFIGARAYKAAVQAIANNTTVATTYDTEEYDSDGFHNNSTNPSRMTIPAGLGGKYRLTAGGLLTTGSSTAELWFRKNGTTALRASGAGPTLHSLGGLFHISVEVDLVAGDYVEALIYQNSGSSKDFGYTGDSDASAAFSVYKLDSGKVGSGIGARVYRGSTQTPITVETTVLFTGEDTDTDGFHDNSTNPDRLTIPAGLGGWYAFTASLYVTGIAANTNWVSARIRKNGLAGVILGAQRLPRSPDDNTIIDASGMAYLAAGDYIVATIDSDDASYTVSTSGTGGGGGVPSFEIVRLDSGSARPTVGYQGFASPPGISAAETTTTAAAITANGGTRIFQVSIESAMLLESVSVWNTDTGTARSWGWDLYAQDSTSSTSLTRVAASSADDAFTPGGAASLRTITASGAPVYLQPGTYWVAIQCRHATNTFGLGSRAAGTMGTQAGQLKTTTNPNGASLDMATGWSAVTSIGGIRLNGRAFGQATAF